MRTAITIFAIVLGLAVVVSVFVMSRGAATESVMQTPQPTTQTDVNPSGDNAPADGDDASTSQASNDNDAAPDSSQTQATDNDQAAQTPGDTDDAGPDPATGDTTATADDDADNSTDAGTDDGNGTDADTATNTTTDTTAATDTQSAQPELIGLRARAAASNSRAVIGSDEADSPYSIQVNLTGWGAGIWQVSMNRGEYSRIITSDEPYVLARSLTDLPPEAREGASPTFRIYPYAARWVTINGSKPIDLQSVAWTLADHSTTLPVAGENGQPQKPGLSQATYELTIEDADGNGVVKLTRTYQLETGSYDMQLQQFARNLTDETIDLVWCQNIHGDVSQDQTAYLGDRRLCVAGYFHPAQDERGNRLDPNRTTIHTEKGSFNRTNIIDRGDIWPIDGLYAGSRLAWLAVENRYFAMATHAIIPDDARQTRDVMNLDEPFPVVDAAVYQGKGGGEAAVVFTLQSDQRRIAPGTTADLSLAAYAGPRKKEVFAEHPYNLLQFGQLIRYELGCTWCTFQFLAKFLLSFLELIHSILGDWGVAIIILVIVVRLLLHPLTKKAQVNMMKMGKQMQTLQPELEKLKKKYKDDQQKLNSEMMKLYREKGVNPAGMLGCLPMFLQMPIWVALYAMLYFAIELRHEPAFYGVFQAISGGNWHFLADLSSPDNFIRFVPIGQEGIQLNLLFIHPHFAGVNILPLLMAVVFFFQQKFTTPPPANDQAAQQQKIMKFMVLLFPIMLYSAPSGLTLYILASTGAGVIDSYLVRKHVREQEESGKLFEKKPRKPGGLMDRLSKAVEQKQQQMQQKQAEAGKSSPGGRNFKKRK